METYIGMDLGGTKLLIGEVDAEGNVLRSHKYESGATNKHQALEIICRSYRHYTDNVGFAGEVKALGLGMVGRVSNREGRWYEYDVAASEPMDIAEIISSEFALPCYIDNDVRAATKAIKVFGQGKLTDNFIYINVGTGIAAGFVIDGRVLYGAHSNSGEVGHTAVGAGDNEPCDCGRRGCVENFAGGRGFDKSARRLIGDYPDSRLQIPADGKPLKSQDVFDLFAQGDPLCVRLVENAAQGLAELIMNLIRVSDPDMIVLGGGMVANGVLLPMINERIGEGTARYLKYGVALSELGVENSGVIGAATVAMNIA